ncbi:carbon-nitrogen hydrolase family protein [Candidatus Latescibacterota bacterium]
MKTILYLTTSFIILLNVSILTLFAAEKETQLTSTSINGHPVKISSICYPVGEGRTLDDIVRIVDSEAAKGADLICLPEICRGQSHPETLDGETITAMSGIAKNRNCYIVCPIDRKEGNQRFNSSVLIDRNGKIACVYDKVFPYWSEFEIDPPIDPSMKDVQVYETDFGKVGFSICYDAKFPEVFQRLRDKGAELIVWSSAYSGYTELQAFAIQHHYYIITSTWTRDCLVYDITGKCLLDEKSDDDFHISRITLDMDRRIYHYNFNTEKRNILLEEHSNDIMLEEDMPREEWFVLKAKRPGISVRNLAAKYGLEELRDYKDRSRSQINDIRGFSFSEKFGGYPR